MQPKCGVWTASITQGSYNAGLVAAAKFIALLVHVDPDDFCAGGQDGFSNPIAIRPTFPKLNS